MSIREDLEEALRRPVRTARDAELVGQAAELLAEYLILEERARRVTAKGSPSASDRNSRSGDLSGVTLDDAAERVLAEAGVPLHVRELGARIKARGWRHPRSRNARPDQIFFQLAARLPRHPERFQRVSPNTFALIGWEKEGAAKRPRPKTGLFSGPGTGIAEGIGASDEPFTAEGSAWRSS
jgi:hypothetical protein